MQIQVYDTYVERKDGETMHFDVFLEKENGSPEKAVESGRKYLDSVGEKEAKITSEECSYCHVQDATEEQIKSINENGYFIYKMGDNCL